MGVRQMIEFGGCAELARIAQDRSLIEALGASEKVRYLFSAACRAIAAKIAADEKRGPHSSLLKEREGIKPVADMTVVKGDAHSRALQPGGSGDDVHDLARGERGEAHVPDAIEMGGQMRLIVSIRTARVVVAENGDGAPRYRHSAVSISSV